MPATYEVTVTMTNGAETVVTGEQPTGLGSIGSSPRLYSISERGALNVMFDGQYYTFAAGEWASVKQVIAE
jgi:hypothetical protein